MKNRPKMRVESIDTLLGMEGLEGSTEIEISLSDSFQDHPFKVLDDENMIKLVESIKTFGVLTPVLLRPKENGRYEMVSGHRRIHASELAGLTKVPAIIKDLSDDEAICFMVDSNIQREELLPSEKAFAFRMKMEGQVKRYIRLTELIREYLDMVDAKKITRSTLHR